MTPTFQHILALAIIIPLSAFVAAIFTPIILKTFEALLRLQAKHRARKRLNQVEHLLHTELLFAPAQWEPISEHDRHETECQNLRTEMDSIIRRYGIHPFDSIKPF